MHWKYTSHVYTYEQYVCIIYAVKHVTVYHTCHPHAYSYVRASIQPHPCIHTKVIQCITRAALPEGLCTYRLYLLVVDVKVSAEWLIMYVYSDVCSNSNTYAEVYTS